MLLFFVSRSAATFTRVQSKPDGSIDDKPAEKRALGVMKTRWKSGESHSRFPAPRSASPSWLAGSGLKLLERQCAPESPAGSMALIRKCTLRHFLTHSGNFVVAGKFRTSGARIIRKHSDRLISPILRSRIDMRSERNGDKNISLSIWSAVELRKSRAHCFESRTSQPRGRREHTPAHQRAFRMQRQKQLGILITGERNRPCKLLKCRRALNTLPRPPHTAHRTPLQVHESLRPKDSVSAKKKARSSQHTVFQLEMVSWRQAQSTRADTETEKKSEYSGKLS